jgi:hypothetical protein
VEALMEAGEANPEVEYSYLVFDPKNLHSVNNLSSMLCMEQQRFSQEWSFLSRALTMLGQKKMGLGIFEIVFSVLFHRVIDLQIRGSLFSDLLVFIFYNLNSISIPSKEFQRYYFFLHDNISLLLFCNSSISNPINGEY